MHPVNTYFFGNPEIKLDFFLCNLLDPDLLNLAGVNGSPEGRDLESRVKVLEDLRNQIAQTPAGEDDASMYVVFLLGELWVSALRRELLMHMAQVFCMVVYYFSIVTIYTNHTPQFSKLWLRIPIYISTMVTQLNPEVSALGETF